MHQISFLYILRNRLKRKVYVYWNDLLFIMNIKVYQDGCCTTTSLMKIWLTFRSKGYDNTWPVSQEECIYFVTIEITAICWNFNPTNSTDLLSTKMSRNLLISPSIYLLLESAYFSTKIFLITTFTKALIYWRKNGRKHLWEDK